MSMSIASNTSHRPRVAYFCMEYGINSRVPIYSGGLGVLAGDTLKSAADLGMNVVGIGLLYRKGYSRQEIDWGTGNPIYHPVDWDPEQHGLTRLPFTVPVPIGHDFYQAAIWRYEIPGINGTSIALFLLDSHVRGNPEPRITDYLYRGADPNAPQHPWWRLAQESFLGIGGLKTIRELERQGMIEPREVFHLNEGHAAFALAEHLQENGGVDALEAHRHRFVFTTHTPVPAGHDRHPLAWVRHVLPRYYDTLMRLDPSAKYDGHLNMTHVALRAGRANAVAERHAKETLRMFPQNVFPYRPDIQYVTNGVHHLTWVSKPMAAVYDQHLGLEWRTNPKQLEKIAALKEDPIFCQDLRTAHAAAKAQLITYINERNHGAEFDNNPVLIGLARRAATYKRLELILSDPQALKAIARQYGPIQIVIAGKNHPNDNEGREVIQRIIERIDALRRDKDLIIDGIPLVRATFLENYDMDTYEMLAGGCDLWVNTPIPPREASGTSGMGISLNGGLNVSTPDGWWLEAGKETGWTITHPEYEINDREAAFHLYRALDSAVRAFYQRPNQFTQKMIHAIAVNGSQFNTHRMVQEYERMLWIPAANGHS